DIDNDGYMDVLSASVYDNKVAWYKNLNGLGNFSSQKVISTNMLDAVAVRSNDVDGDGDMDVIAASRMGDKICWFENTDGLGTFSGENIITTSAYGVESISMADIDGDGDIDLLSGTRGDDKVGWYKNLDGLGTFSTQLIITNATNAPYSIFAADADNDGDLDVFTASRDDN